MKKIVLSTLLVLSAVSYAETAKPIAEADKPIYVWTWSKEAFNAKDVYFVTHQQNKELKLNAPAYVIRKEQFQTVYLPQVVPIDADRRTCAGGTKCGQPWLTAEEVQINEEIIKKK